MYLPECNYVQMTVKPDNDQLEVVERSYGASE